MVKHVFLTLLVLVVECGILSLLSVYVPALLSGMDSLAECVEMVKFMEDISVVIVQMEHFLTESNALLLGRHSVAT